MYGYKKEVSLNFERTVEVTKKELKKEGFGVLTEIDVKSTLKNKLGVDFDNYLILGACNPPFAHKALKFEEDIGLMLPCNLIVHEKEGKTAVTTILPTVAMGVIDNSELKVLAKEIEDKLKRVVDNVE